MPKKEHTASKEPKTYSEIVSYFGKKEYYKKFMKLLEGQLPLYNTNIKKIIELVRNKKLKIINPEVYLNPDEEIKDVCISSYEKSSTLEKYLFNLAYKIKECINKGYSTIVLNEFFIHLSTFIENDINKYFPLFKGFILSISTITQNPVTIRIPDSKISRVLTEKHLDKERLPNSNSIISLILKAYKELYNVKGSLNLPNLEVLRAVYADTSSIQKSYLQSIFYNIGRTEINNLLDTITDETLHKSVVYSALNHLASLNKFVHFNPDPVILELKRLGNEGAYRTYEYRETLQDIYKNAKLSINDADILNIKDIYINLDSFKKSCNPVFSEVVVDCENLSADGIKVLIKYATIINLIKRGQFEGKYKQPLKVTLSNVDCIHPKDYVSFCNEIIRNESQFNVNLVLEVQYSNRAGRSCNGLGLPSHLRIISDIHADINEGKGYVFNFGDDFVLNCGDTAGDCLTAANWIRTNMRRGVFTYGNHMGYSHPFNDKIKNSSSEQREFLHTNFGHRLTTESSCMLTYLSNNFLEVNGTIIIGTPLFTDFCLYGEERQKECMRTAKYGMNDFKYVNLYLDYDLVQEGYHRTKKVVNEDKRVRSMQPTDYLHRFIGSINYVERVLKKNPNKPVVVFSHFAPLPFSLEDKYKSDPLSATFASDLRWLFKKYDNLRVWASGHVHHNTDYIYENTRVVSCPFGYYSENNGNKELLPFNYGKRISFEDVKSMKKWPTLLVKEILNHEVEIKKDKDWFLPIEENKEDWEITAVHLKNSIPE